MKRVLGLLLCLGMLAGLIKIPAIATEATVTQTLASLEGTTAISWQNYYDKAATNSGLSCTKVTNGAGLFAQYFQLEAVRADNNEKNSQLTYKDAADGSKLGFAGTVQAGESVLIHLIARSSNNAKVFMALWKNGTGASTDNGTSAGYITPERLQLDEDWQEFYIPVKAGSVAPDSFVFFVQNKGGKVDLAYMEMINYGATPPEPAAQ